MLLCITHLEERKRERGKTFTASDLNGVRLCTRGADVFLNYFVLLQQPGVGQT